MSTVRGFFDPETALSATGYMRGALFTYAPTLRPRGFSRLDICLKIDTGSRHTLLLDQDFMNLLTLVCPVPLASSATALQWVRTRPDLFVPQGRYRTVGGTTPPMFCIQYAWLQLANPDDQRTEG